MNKKQVKTKEDLEQYYTQCRKIKFSDRINPKTPDDIFNIIRIQSEPTYFKKGSEHCERYKIRSIDDYINLCKNYFPKLTVSEIIQEFVKSLKVDRGDNKVPHVRFCPNIKKDNISYNYYGTYEHETNMFLEKSFYKQGFPNCYIKYKEFL